MYMILFIALLAQVVWCDRGLNEDFLGWHQKVGIKEAQRIKEAEDRIVGGTIAPLFTHPYLAGILVDLVGLSIPSACGGTILTNARILTAAHCWNDGRFQAWRMTAVLGSAFLYHGGVRIKSSSIAMHPQYNPRTLANDVAVLKLPVRFQFSNTIRSIALPGSSFANFNFTGMWAQASGFGRYSDLSKPTSNAMVRHVSLQIISQQQCRSIYGDIVLDSNICTSGSGGVGICQGDSGGPLTVKIRDQDIIVGVSSFVARDGCELGFPSAFARVLSFLSWIKKQV